MKKQKPSKPFKPTRASIETKTISPVKAPATGYYQTHPAPKPSPAAIADGSSSRKMPEHSTETIAPIAYTACT